MSQVRFAEVIEEHPPGRRISDIPPNSTVPLGVVQTYPPPTHQPRRHVSLDVNGRGRYGSGDHYGPDPEHDRRFSAVPLYPGDHSREERRGSDDTLYDEDAVAPDKVGKPEDARKRSILRSRSFDYPPQHPPPAARHISRDIENGKSKKKGGVFNKIKRAFRDLTKDQEIPSVPESRPPSRRNSTALGQAYTAPHPHNNLEQSMAINADVEEMDPYDDDYHWRHRHEASAGEVIEMRRPTLEETRRKSYAERRKKEKHRIIYCAERE